MRGAILAQFGAILRNSAQFSDAPPHLPGVFIGFLTDELLFNAVGKLILSVAPPGIAAPKPAAAADGAAAKADEKNGKNGSKAGSKAKKPPGAKKPESKPPGSAEYDELMGAYGEMKKVVLGVYNTRWSLIGRVVIWLWAARQMQPRAKEFYDYSQQFAEALSQPQIMYKARLQVTGRRCHRHCHCRCHHRRRHLTSSTTSPCRRGRRSSSTTTARRTSGCATTRPPTRA